MAHLNRSDWPTLEQANAYKSKHPLPPPRAHTNLDPEAPGFVPQGSNFSFLRRDVPNMNLVPQNRRQAGPRSRYFQRGRIVKPLDARNADNARDPRSMYYQPRLIQHVDPRDTDNDHEVPRSRYFQQGRSVKPADRRNAENAHQDPRNTNLQSLRHRMNPDTPPFVEGRVNIAPYGYQRGDYKARRQSHTSTAHTEPYFFHPHGTNSIPVQAIEYERASDNTLVNPQIPRNGAYESRMNDAELPPTYSRTGFYRNNGDWVAASEVVDDGRARGLFELQHRVASNRITLNRPKAPIKPVLRLLHQDIREQWFGAFSTVRLNESMKGYAQRIAELNKMSEEDLELLTRDRESGQTVTEIRLVYRGVHYV